MIRGTTAQFKFKLPYTKEELEWVTIKFWQPGNNTYLLPITKRLEHCETTDDHKELCLSLTPEETSRFSDKYKAKVQLRAMCTASNAIFGCKPKIVSVYPMRDDIIEENPTLPAENEEGWVVLDGETITTR